MSEAILGVIVGAVLGFVGVGAQLWHDARQRRVDRLMQLRRDVFLEAAEGVAGSQQFFFRFANPEIPFSKIGDVQSQKPGWLNKLHIVAGIETIEAFSKADLVLGSASFDLLRRRNLLQQTDDQIEVTKQAIEQAMRYQEQIRETVRLTVDEPTTESTVARAEWAAKNCEFVRQDITRLTEVQSQQIDRRWQLHRSLLQKSTAYYAAFQDHLSPALVALRNEIELPIDNERFASVMKAHNASVRAEVGRLLDGIGNDEAVEEPEAG